MATTVLSPRALNRATLARQMLLAREGVTPLAAIERVLGLQAQWPKPPFFGLWSRLEGFRREDLCQLVRERGAVRGTMMRGTLHLVSARDYLELRPVLQPLLTRGLQSVLKQRKVELDFADLLAAARPYLEDGPRTFEQVRDHLLGHFPQGDERAMGHAVRMLLPLVMEPTDADWGYPTVCRFALAEAWLGEPLRPEAGEEGLGALVLRYLAAFGPATVADAQTWSGLQRLRPAFEALRPRLAAFRDERGRELFDLPEAPRPPADTAAPVRFLPEFDSVVLAHDDRSRVIADEHRPAVYRPGLRVLPTVLVDGAVAGTWKTERKKKVAALVVEPFKALPKVVREELAEEGERLLRFAEPDAGAFELRWPQKAGGGS